MSGDMAHISDETYRSYFGDSAPRWQDLAQREPGYHEDIAAFIGALAPLGILSSSPVVDDTAIFSHSGLRRLIEEFIQRHPTLPLPLERITLVRAISADSCRADLESLLTTLAAKQDDLIRVSNSYNIAVDLNLHLSGIDAGLLLKLCEFRERLSLETATLIYSFPPITTALAAHWRLELEALLADPRSRLPGVFLAGFPLCLALPARFKDLLRYSLHGMNGLIGTQRRAIQTTLGSARDILPSCTPCRCRHACHAFTNLGSHPDHDAIVVPRHEDAVAFLGGSCPGTLPPADDRLVITTPAEQGDLLMAILSGFQTILIIDGYFYTRFPCTTFEVMLALERGLNVFGAASIGALRAVELDRYGMTGTGTVYKSLLQHRIKPYHWVAQTYRDDDTALTTPLVEIVYFLEVAVSAGILTQPEADRALAIANDIPFPILSFDTFFSQVHEVAPSARLSAFFSEQGMDAFSIKKKDALELLSSFRDILAGREPDHVSQAFIASRETYLGRLKRKYPRGADLTLPGNWATNPTTPGIIPPAAPSTGRRAVSAGETCRRAEAFFADLDVIVADTTGYDPPASSIVINVFFPALYFLGYPLSCSTGNGDLPEDALASAYMELVERIPTHNFPIQALKYGELDQDPLNAELVPQYVNFKVSPLVKQKVLSDHGYVRATEIISGSEFFIPRFAVMSLYTGTDGNAAGNTLSEAILYGLYELIERDTNQLYLLDPVCRAHVNRLRLDPVEFGDEGSRTLLHHLEEKGYKVVTFLLPNEFGLPCIRCQVFDLNRRIECHGSTAVRSDIPTALRATLHEAAMQHLSYFTGVRDDYRPMASLKESHIAYQTAKATLFGSASAPPQRGLAAYQRPAPFTSVPEELNGVLERLKSTGLRRIIVADTSPSDDHGVKSVKVIVPGLELWFVPEYQPSGSFAGRALKTRAIMEGYL